MSDPLNILSPYNASIDLSTSEGQKLFQAASREGTKDDERVVVSMGTAKAMLEHFIDEESSFSLHGVTNIPIEFELTYDSGTTDVDGCKVIHFCNILCEVNTLTLASVQRFARCIWCYFYTVMNSFIVQSIVGSRFFILCSGQLGWIASLLLGSLRWILSTWIFAPFFWYLAIINSEGDSIYDIFFGEPKCGEQLKQKRQVPFTNCNKLTRFEFGSSPQSDGETDDWRYKLLDEYGHCTSSDSFDRRYLIHDSVQPESQHLANGIFE